MVCHDMISIVGRTHHCLRGGGRQAVDSEQTQEVADGQRGRDRPA
jgi:hypothetical protein